MSVDRVVSVLSYITVADPGFPKVADPGFPKGGHGKWASKSTTVSKGGSSVSSPSFEELLHISFTYLLSYFYPPPHFYARIRQLPRASPPGPP
jgi:hypothetical protein